MGEDFKTGAGTAAGVGETGASRVGVDVILARVLMFLLLARGHCRWFANPATTPAIGSDVDALVVMLQVRRFSCSI